MPPDTWESEAKPRIEAQCPAVPPVHQKMGISEPGKAASRTACWLECKRTVGDKRETEESLNILCALFFIFKLSFGGRNLEALNEIEVNAHSVPSLVD